MSQDNLKLKPRKIQSIGYSFFVSVPLLFIENNNLKKGDKLEMEITQEKHLIMKPKKK